MNAYDDEECPPFCGCYECQTARRNRARAHLGNAEPVTVGELVDALATYPRDAEVMTEEAGTGTGTIEVLIGGRSVTVWDGTTSSGDWHDPENVPFDELRPKARGAK